MCWPEEVEILYFFCNFQAINRILFTTGKIILNSQYLLILQLKVCVLCPTSPISNLSSDSHYSTLFPSLILLRSTRKWDHTCFCPYELLDLAYSHSCWEVQDFFICRGQRTSLHMCINNTYRCSHHISLSIHLFTDSLFGYSKNVIEHLSL